MLVKAYTLGGIRARAQRILTFRRLVVVLLFVVGIGTAFGASAAAAPASDVLWTSCKEEAQPNDLRCVLPRGVAANSRNGHVFVGDQANKRIVEINATGRLVKAWGWDVVQSGPGDDAVAPEDQFEICVPHNGDVCKNGLNGSGPGQIGSPQGLAVDSAGAIYVVDRPNHRVQKFDSDGNFVLMFGGGVNQGGGTPSNAGNICTAEHLANGDVCGAGTTGTGNGQFSEGWVILGDYLANDPSDQIYVGDEHRIQHFDTDGHYLGDVPVDADGDLGKSSVKALDTDSAGNLYVIYEGKRDVRKIIPLSGQEPESPRFKAIAAEGEESDFPTALSVTPEGHVFVFGRAQIGSGTPILVDPIHEFDPAGKEVQAFGKGEFAESTGMAANLCPGSEPPGNLFVSNSVSGVGPPASKAPFVRAYGTDPVGCFKARTLPADPVAEITATLHGTVNPDGGPVSECRFEYGLTEAYDQSQPCVETSGQIGEGIEPVQVHAGLTGLTAGTVYHFRLRAKIGGEDEDGADLTFKTFGPPVITRDRTVMVNQTDAALRGLVNPEGFISTYHVEYGLTEAYGQSTPSVPVGADGDRSEHAVAATLEGLSPGSIYHWRIVANNSSGTTASDDHIITTYGGSDGLGGSCANSVLRSGPSAFLPDCRAYEMVSPIEKNGGDILNGPDNVADPGGYVQAAPSGDRLAYTATAVFDDQPNSFRYNEYLAERGAGGWSNQGVHPPVTGGATDSVLLGLHRDFMAFTPDLCSTWFIDYQTPPITPDSQPGFRNLYRRDNCAPGAGAYEAMIPFPPGLPEGTKSENYVDQSSVQGISEDGRHAVFTARAALTANAPAGSALQVYDRIGGQNHLVSILPRGVGSDAENGIGSSGPIFNLQHAVSEDGSLIYWTASLASGRGRLYVRRNASETQSPLENGGAVGTGNIELNANVLNLNTVAGTFEVGQRIAGDGIPWGTTITAKSGNELTLSANATKSALGVSLESFSECTEANKACTLQVNAGTSAFFQAAAVDGSKALYIENGELLEFDLVKAEEGIGPRLIANEVSGIVGTSDDLARIYFVSRSSLTGAAQDGKPNLYLEDHGALVFIGLLVEGDVVQSNSGVAYNLSGIPYQRGARTSPDGSEIVFESRASLTGYDNLDAEEGKDAVEVFRYEVGDSLICVSCNPSGAQPLASAMPIPFAHPWAATETTSVLAAAWIPTWEHPLNPSHLLSGDGNRLFFNANDALLPRDVNGAQDVYEWEAAGTGTCKTTSPAYFSQNGGCLFLISSGESSYESEFWEASPDGEDVFFTTLSSLLPQDPGSIDLYDARVGGGFPAAEKKVPCEGEACQSPMPPPPFNAPSSSTFEGPGNVAQARVKKRRCAKGKRKVRSNGNVRCLKRKHPAKHKRRGQR
jgi:NHL repeat-containing protein